MITNDGEIILNEEYEASTERPGVFLRTPYNYNMDEVSLRTGLTTPEPTMTKQEFAEEADINTLVQRFGLTGQMPQLERVPMQGDFTGITDYKSAVDAILAAENEFMKLPADLRKRFDNDPQQFLDFTSDEKNRDELRTLGLLKPEPTKPEPMEVRVVNPEPPPAA